MENSDGSVVFVFFLLYAMTSIIFCFCMRYVCGCYGNENVKYKTTQKILNYPMMFSQVRWKT